MWASYLIPAENFEKFAAKMGQLEKAAAKCGTPFSWRRVPDVTRYCPHPFRKNQLLELVAVEVNGEAPALGGWTLVGVLDFELGPAIVREVPGEEVPAAFRDSGPVCDHCQKVRTRAETFVVRHEDGTFKRVGRQCLADFLGHEDPGAAALLATYLMRMADVGWADEWGGGGFDKAPEIDSLVGFLGVVAALSGAYGWVPRSAVKDEIGKTSTSEDAWHIRTCTKGPHACDCCKALKADDMAPTEKQGAAVAAAVEWAKALSPKNSYESNLQVISQVGVVTWRTAGLAASLLAAHRKVLEKAEAAKAVNNEWAGTVGKRETWTLRLLSQHEWESQFGVTTFYRFADDAGRTFVWAASRPQDLEIGATYAVKGTVKRHGEYKGVRETCLSRCVVTEMPVAAE